MLGPRLSLAAIVFTLAACVNVGCDSSSQAPEPEPIEIARLRDVGNLLRSVGRASSVADLAPGQNLFFHGYESVKSGDVVVVWGARMLDEDASNAPDAVIAYDKQAPDAGGNALMSNGNVRTLTAAEFAAVPKAGK